jgi:hypothetical protein
LSGVENVYGIDYKLGFNYPKLMEIAENSESEFNNKFLQENLNSLEKFNKLSLLKKFRVINKEEWRSETLIFYPLCIQIRILKELK